MIRDKTVDKLAVIVGQLCAFGEGVLRGQTPLYANYASQEEHNRQQKTTNEDCQHSMEKYFGLRLELFNLIPEEKLKRNFPEVYKHVQMYEEHVTKPTLLSPM